MKINIKWNCNSTVPGSIRVKEYFSFFPIIIESEIRWLEIVKVKQEYTMYSSGSIDDSAIYCWKNIEFLN